MPRHSAGLLLYRAGAAGWEVLLAHPGGPLWARRDDGAWSIPKGEYAPGEDAWAAARREFAEEVGSPAPAGPRLDLGATTQSGGKVVTAFAVPGDLDVGTARSNTFTMIWPPHSQTVREFPEVDRVAWFDPVQARAKLLAGQRIFLDRLAVALGSKPG